VALITPQPGRRLVLRPPVFDRKRAASGEREDE
jgi:hypothetical protein